MSHPKEDRNREICRRIEAGENGCAVAKELRVSHQRVYAIYYRDRGRLTARTRGDKGESRET